MTNISREMLQTYLVAGTQNTGMDDFLNILEQALQAGITCFQFREKGAGSLQDFDAILKYATAAQALCRHYQVPFIIDDNLDLALQINADGIHVGQSDQPWHKIETAKAHGLITGLSCHTEQELHQSHNQPILDYIGIGPIFPTNSKEDAKPALGTDRLRFLTQQSELPVVAIGGINQENVAQVAKTTVNGVAVISAITHATDIAQAVQALQKPWHRSTDENQS